MAIRGHLWQSVAIRGHRTYERWYSFSLNARTAASLNSSATVGASAELGLSSGRVFGGTYLWGSRWGVVVSTCMHEGRVFGGTYTGARSFFAA